MKQKKLFELLSKIPSLSEDSEGMLRGGFAAISGTIPTSRSINKDCVNTNCDCPINSCKNTNCDCTTQKPSGTSNSSKGMNFFQFF